MFVLFVNVTYIIVCLLMIVNAVFYLFMCYIPTLCVYIYVYVCIFTDFDLA